MAMIYTYDRTKYNLKNKIEPPSLSLLMYFHCIDGYIWINQLYLLVISFLSWEALSEQCDSAHPELGEYCYEQSIGFTKILNDECEDSRSQRFDACQLDSECDIFISSQYGLENSWSCDGFDCECAAGEIYYAIPMLMTITFGLSFIVDWFKCLGIKWFFTYDHIEKDKVHIFPFHF